MEKITVNYIKEFVRSKKLQLIPSQKRLCVPIIHRICQKMANGIKFADIKICEGLIIDGHHRYISAQITVFTIGKTPGQRTSTTSEYTWEDIEFDENDWDTASKIKILNETDAAYNGVDIDAINQMIQNLE